MELPNEWLEFLSLLQRHDAKFVIVGAYAMAVHGRPRASQDIDILIEPSAANAERVAQALDEFGYPELAKESVEAFTKSLRGELEAHGIDVTKINPGPYNTGFNDRMVNGITEYIDAGDTSAHETNEVVRQIVLTDQLDPMEVARTLADLAEAEETPPETLLPEGIGELLQAMISAEGY